MFWHQIAKQVLVWNRFTVQTHNIKHRVSKVADQIRCFYIYFDANSLIFNFYLKSSSTLKKQIILLFNYFHLFTN